MVEYTSIGYIYALYSNANPTHYRYIGYTVEPRKRYMKHLREAKRLQYHRHKWIMSEINKGNRILMKIIKVCKEEDLQITETKFIREYKNLGHHLTNGNEGGLGGINPTEEIRHRLSLSKIGNKYSLGMKHTEEFKQNLSKRMKGRKLKQSTIDKLRIINLNKNKKDSKRLFNEEDIVKMFELYNKGFKIKDICKELNTKKSNISNILYTTGYREVKNKYNLKLQKRK